MPTSFREIGNICNSPERQRLKKFVDEHSYLTRILMTTENKYFLGYYLPIWIRGFFLNPTRCRYLYSTSLVIDGCQKAINSLILDPNSDFRMHNNLIYFFMPPPTPSGEIPIANATRFLGNARHGPDRRDLLLFLNDLSEIRWFGIYNRGWSRRRLTNRIIHWVCTTLVG